VTVVLVLDSSGVSKLAERSRAAALIHALREQDIWPPVVPSIVLVECLQGHTGRDAMMNRFLKICGVRRYFAEKPADAPPSMRSSSPPRNPAERR
jgi:hypothetical protein